MKNKLQKIMMMGLTTMMVLGGCSSTTNSSSEGTIRVGGGDGYELLSKSTKDGRNEYILQRKEGNSINKYHLSIGSGAYVMPLFGPDNEIVCDKIKNKDIGKGKKIIVHIQ